MKHIAIFTLLLSFAFTFITVRAAITNSSVVIDLDGSRSAFPSTFYECFGSDHGAMHLRKDLQEQIILAKEEIGFQYLRFHGIFMDEMSVVKFGEYRWQSIYKVYDFLLANGIKPIVELSFMPQEMASDQTRTVFHYEAHVSPPRDYDAWGDLIFAFVSALCDRYGVEEVRLWRFEVWNEPNLRLFWAGDMQEYFHLYDVTARAVKAVDALLLVGGPVTSSTSWIDEFISFVQNSSVPCDFISTHLYPIDDQSNRYAFFDSITIAFEKSYAAGYPFFITEYNPGFSIPVLDVSYAAAFLYYQIPIFTPLAQREPLYHSNSSSTVTAITGSFPIHSYWVLSDLFEEFGMPNAEFGEYPENPSFGIITMNGIRKPVWRAFELLSQGGDEMVSSSQTPSIRESNLASFVLYDEETNAITIYLANYELYFIGIPETQIVTISILPSDDRQLPQIGQLYLIDEVSCNPRRLWDELGSPAFPTEEQFQLLHQESNLSPIDYPIENGYFQVSVKPNGVAVLRIQL